MTALGFFVTVFIVASTFASLTARRRQELGLLRLVGALPNQVQRMVLIESAITGTLGGFVGAVYLTWVHCNPGQAFPTELVLLGLLLIAVIGNSFNVARETYAEIFGRPKTPADR